MNYGDFQMLSLNTHVLLQNPNILFSEGWQLEENMFYAFVCADHCWGQGLQDSLQTLANSSPPEC